MTRKMYDRVMKSITYLATSFTALILLAIVIFTFRSGTGLLSMQLITGDYHPENYAVDLVDLEDDDYCYCDYEGTLPEDSFYSSKWGIMLTDTVDTEGMRAIQIGYIDEDSPFNNGVRTDDQTTQKVVEGAYLNNFFSTDKEPGYTKDGSEVLIQVMEDADEISLFQVTQPGGGIRGSIISTFYLIIITLGIAVPFGVLTAIYMNEYSKQNKAIKLLKTMIDALTGVPSIIFGLMGAAIFIPMVNNISGTEGHFGSIMAGALTMSVILLPVIVKTTTQALNQVPKDLRSASLALGANTTQTTFKVVLGSSIPGIVSGIILGIGRIVGESAALVFAMGTLISDNPELFDRSTSLAVHIWTVMAGESPNFELASAIALIILMVVLLLNISVKLLTKKFNKMGRA